MKRLLTAAVFLPGFLAVVLYAPAWALAVIAALAVAMSVLEFAKLAKRCGLRVHRVLAVAAGVAACFLFLEPVHASERLLWLCLGGCGLMLLAGLIRDGGGRALPSAAVSLLAMFYPGILLAHVVGLRAAGGETGRQLLLFLLAVIWLSDTAAFYVGRAVGRHKLAPRISPNKTVEGAVAAVLAGAAAAFLWKTWFLPQAGSYAALVGAGLAVLGILGDAVESAIKRGAGVKDSAGVLPGHGGVLDRVDSLLLTAPLFYHLYPWIVG